MNMSAIEQLEAQIKKLNKAKDKLISIERRRELEPLVGKYFIASDSTSHALYKVISFGGWWLTTVLVVISKGKQPSFQVSQSSIGRQYGKQITEAKFNKMVREAFAKSMMV
jgi:hypothetical protein